MSFLSRNCCVPAFGRNWRSTLCRGARQRSRSYGRRVAAEKFSGLYSIPGCWTSLIHCQKNQLVFFTIVSRTPDGHKTFPLLFCILFPSLGAQWIHSVFHNACRPMRKRPRLDGKASKLRRIAEKTPVTLLFANTCDELQ